MKIDFNNVRIQALHAYDKLCRALNESQEYEGHMLVDPNDIQEAMDDLRNTIGAIAMSYDEGNDDCKNVFPEGHKMESFEFNSEEE